MFYSNAFEMPLQTIIVFWDHFVLEVKRDNADKEKTSSDCHDAKMRIYIDFRNLQLNLSMQTPIKMQFDF